MATQLTAAHHVLPGAATWSATLRRGWALELEDVDGGANAVLLLVDAAFPTERLNVPDTLKAQHVARIGAGVALYSDMGRVMASVTEDSCGWHDPLCGPGTHTRGLVLELAKHGLDRRDLVGTINLFSKVTVDAAGRLALHPSASPAGARVAIRAERDVLVLLSAVPHPLDPGGRPGPIGLAVREVGPAEPDDPVRTACTENERGFAVTERSTR